MEDKKSLIAGVDEVGKGCLFGPVFAAAVILSKENEIEWVQTPASWSLMVIKFEALSLTDKVAFGPPISVLTHPG